jgi:ketosteroid isomerase-like protein
MKDARDKVERVLATIEAFWAAYDAGDPGFFDFFTADAVIFSLSFPIRLRGPEAYRRYFGPEFTSESRATQILHPEVILVGEGALVTSQNRVRVNYRSVDSRTTLLLVPNGDALKVAHLHMSPLLIPSPADGRGLVEEVAAIAAPADR